jgi:hypothetical protein
MIFICEDSSAQFDCDLSLAPSPTSILAPVVPGCDNSNSNLNPDYINKYKKIETYIPDSNTPIKHLKIAFHIFTGPGTVINSPTTISDANQVVAWINGFYTNVVPASYPIAGTPYLNDTKIRFDLDSRIFFYNGTSLYNNTSINTLQSYVQSVDPSRMDYLNIYFTAGSSLPYSFTPYPNFILGGSSSTSSLYGDQGIFMQVGSSGFNYVHAQTLAHEIGHALDLYHTYQPSCCHETCNSSDPDFLYDLFGASPPSVCWEQGSFGCTVTPGTNICTNNMMGGVNLLNYYFSPMQIGKLHRALSIKNTRKYVKETPFNPIAHNITVNETWDFDIRWYSDIVVKTGVTMTVKCKILMADQAKIIVERGATLIIDGGTITSAYQMWKGIEVWGDRTKSQLPSAGITYQGKVILKNGAKIENAVEGILTIKRDNTGVFDWNYTGGIIKADNSMFYNCKTAVAYLSYQNFIPTNPTVKLNNQGYFKNCEFKTTGQLKNLSISPYAFISMYDVQGIRFLGNLFRNEASITDNLGIKGDGIISVDAKYVVTSFCNVLPPFGSPCPTASSFKNSFENLQYGINASAGISPLNTLTVNNTNFSNNEFSLYIKTIDYPTITNNTFNIPSSSFPPIIPLPTYGVYLDNSTGFKLENNNFTTSEGGWIGSYVNNSQYYANSVYNNYYSNLYVGNIAANDNLDNSMNIGLKMNCDDFITNGYDIAILPATNPTTDVDQFQGLCVTGQPKYLTRNSYSAYCTGSENQYYVDKSSSYYIVHANSNELFAEPACKDPLVLSGDCSGMTRNRPLDCPSTLGGTYASISSTKAAILAQIPQLKVALDDGGSPILISSINSQISPGQLKDLLISKSPYLSDQVLISYINLIHLPPFGNLKNVILANSPVSDDVINALNVIPLPAGIRQDINSAQTGISSRTNLEGQIQMLRAENDLLLSDKIRLFLNDTVISNPMDSVIQILKTEGRTDIRCKLIDAYIANKDYAEAQMEVDAMRLDGELDDLCAFKELVITLRQAIEGCYKIQTDNAIKSQIEELANDNSKEGCKNAQSLLQEVFKLKFQEEILLPVTSKSMTHAMPPPAQNIAMVYPNPAQNSVNFMINSDGEELLGAYITISDLLGRQVGKQPVNSKGMAITFTTEGYSNGIYFYSFFNNGQLKESEKFIVNK